MAYNRNDCTIQNGGIKHVCFKWRHFNDYRGHRLFWKYGAEAFFMLDEKEIQYDSMRFSTYNYLQMHTCVVLSDLGALPEESRFLTM